MEVRGILQATKKSGKWGDYAEVKIKDGKWNVSEDKKPELYNKCLEAHAYAVIAQISDDKKYLNSIEIDNSAPPPVKQPTTEPEQTPEEVIFLLKELRGDYVKIGNMLAGQSALHQGDEEKLCDSIEYIHMRMMDYCNRMGLFGKHTIRGVSTTPQGDSQVGATTTSTNPPLLPSWDDVKSLAKKKGITTPNQLFEVLGIKKFEEMSPAVAYQLIQEIPSM